MKCYCQNCGSPNEPVANFCYKCGNGLKVTSKIAKANQKTKFIVQEKDEDDQIEEEDDNEGTEIDRVPNIKKFEFDVQVAPKEKETIGSVKGTRKPEEPKIVRPNQPIKSKEQFLKDFKKEAGEKSQIDIGE